MYLLFQQKPLYCTGVNVQCKVCSVLIQLFTTADRNTIRPTGAECNCLYRIQYMDCIVFCKIHFDGNCELYDRLQWVAVTHFCAQSALSVSQCPLSTLPPQVSFNEQWSALQWWNWDLVWKIFKPSANQKNCILGKFTKQVLDVLVSTKRSKYLDFFSLFSFAKQCKENGSLLCFSTPGPPSADRW